LRRRNVDGFGGGNVGEGGQKGRGSIKGSRGGERHRIEREEEKSDVCYAEVRRKGREGK
jgi:hypothetical protein